MLCWPENLREETPARARNTGGEVVYLSGLFFEGATDVGRTFFHKKKHLGVSHVRESRHRDYVASGTEKMKTCSSAFPTTIVGLFCISGGMGMDRDTIQRA